MLIHWIWLSQLPKISRRDKCRLLQLFHDPEELYLADRTALERTQEFSVQHMQILQQKDLTQAAKILSDCAQKRINILTFHDAAYPDKLKNIEDPPTVLYYKGCLPDWDSVPVLGIVGTRKASAYGLSAAQKLGYQMAGCGALVASGGADGIDAAAMWGALKIGSPVVAVLAFGADIVYPARNKPLFSQVEKQGCLLTEYPPGTPAYSWNFLERNRIISGLSAGVVVVEAPKRSGALNTAAHAADQGRDIFVVPGNINVDSCCGSNELLRENAIAVFSGWDVVREYEILYPGKLGKFDRECPETEQIPVHNTHQTVAKSAPAADKKSIDNPDKSHYSGLDRAKSKLSPEEQALVSHLTKAPCPVDELIAALDMPAGRVLSLLTVLAVKGVVQNHPGKQISLK